MKKLIILLVIVLSTISFAQFRENGLPKPTVKDGIVDQSSGSFFNFLNSDNFMMKHTFNVSYTAGGNMGLALTTYTNSMFYRFADNLNVRADISFIHSPYNTFGKDFQNNLSGIYLSRAAINYRPWEDVSITLQYRNLPGSYYYNPYYGYYGFGYFNQYDDDPFFTR
ncbi:MAG: hypothetical protein HXY49_05805 [Ignavibacteriaceae bacterium]|nr:hypothetical protein [Ignavibacteriaceae bacterium]